MDKYKFGNLICRLREEHNFTQAEFAKRLDVSDKAVSKWENGQAIPRMETLEKMAATLGTTPEDLFAASRENFKRVYFENAFCPFLHLDVNGKTVSTKDEGVWVNIDSDELVLKITGDFDFSEEFAELSDSASGLKEKLLVRLGKWGAKKAFYSILQADCTYKITDIKDGETIKIQFELFSLGDKALTYQDFMIFYPKIERENSSAELLFANAKNGRQIVKEYTRIGIHSDIGLGFLLTLFAYPLRTVYFKHLCKPHVLKANLLNAEKHKAIDEKRNKRKKHGCLQGIGCLLLLVILFFVVEPILNVPHDYPALISADYSTITLYNDEFKRIDKLPFDANKVLTLGAVTWTGARKDGLSRLEQIVEDSKVTMYEDGEGYLYLWLLENYGEVSADENGDYKEYNDFETHLVYKSVKPQA